ncbi:histidine kinase [Catenovulum agarivorans DS-2]|uniref:histidine kinase n=1 Tax=Catenovulum agarivorans DS-2 TaxID=1328313 RepID=W7QXK7_9ALTE|nr:ATP-binding protein [Catenovulum agarivorans]EWH10020.1 histidine kinase [Catenovulum agarivorans DS-2]
MTQQPKQLNTTSSISSIKSNIINMVLFISSVALILAFVTNGYYEFKQQKDTLARQAISYSDIIGFSATSNLIFNDPSAENSRLTNLNLVDNIDNIHIYRYDATANQTEFFASYNKKNVPPIPTKLNQLDNLGTPEFFDKHLEVARVIEFEGQKLGYIYARFTLNKQYQQLWNSLYLKLTVLILSLLTALILALRLQRSITGPIGELVTLFKFASKEKDYSVRAPKQSLIELNGLSSSFNTLLDRFQAYIDKQAQSELEIRKLNQNLEDKVNQRTDALKDANNELLTTLETLHKYQNQLVENEKMASLGDMVAGIAHEVNTPIGLGVTASTLLNDRLREVKNALDNKKLTAKQLDKFLTEGEENLNIIYRNLNRAAELISSFKQVAVDQSNENSRSFKVLDFINDVLLSLRPKIKATPHQINLVCDESLVIESKPGPLNQILINLIMNSIIHAFPDGRIGKIDINISVHSGLLKIIFQDDGVGVDNNMKKRIFDPFVTTKRGEGGSGLGMHLVYNLVTQALNGSIHIESEKDKGVLFKIEIPVNVKKSTN